MCDDAWLSTMLEVEAALARACAEHGLMPAQDADAIARAAAVESFDAQEIGAAAGAGGNPVIPLVVELRRRLEGSAAAHVHLGATSQDILDTATMLSARRATDAALADARAVMAHCEELVARHAGTPMLGRTLLQPAMPITFGLKAAGWLEGTREAGAELARAAERLSVQLGGAAGTLSGFDGRGREVAATLAAELGLARQRLPWHANRVRVARLAAAMALLGGAVAKIARDVVLLAQGEVGEVSERGSEGHGGSSSMAHKHNPIAAVATIACAAQLAPAAALVQASMAGEHERAAGAWHSEWLPLRTCLACGGSALAWSHEMLTRLQLHPERMRANLDRAIAEAGVPAQSGLAAELAADALAGGDDA